ncbi:coiled-coil domain-containing protein mad1 [Rhodotorula kratochvilovae]
MTVGRSSTLLRRPSNSDLGGSHYGNAPATVSRLPTRRPSISGSSVSETPASARPESRIAGVKRRTSAADLQQESETASLKRQLARVLAQAEEYKHSASRASIEASLAADKTAAQLAEQAARIDQLERHRALLLAKEREASEREQARGSGEAEEQARLEGEVRALRAQVGQLRDENADLQESFTDLEHAATQAIAKANDRQKRAELLEAEVVQLREEADECLRAQAAEKKRRVALEAELEQEKSRAKESADAHIIREELHRQVTTLRTLEKENGKLQRRVETYERQHANAELLKETNRALEKKVKAGEELRAQLARQEVELEVLRREKADWAAFVKPEDTDTFSSPRKITKSLATVRIENATLRDRLNSHALEVERRDRIVGALEARAGELERELEGARAELERTRERARSDTAQTGLLRQEVAMLKRHLESYSTEEAIQHTGNFDAQKTARIAELDELLDAHKREVANLTAQVAHWRGLVERYGGNTTEILELEEREKKDGEKDKGKVGESLQEQLRLNEELQQELDEARNELALMEQELDALSTQVEQLEENQGIRGAYNPATHKVLEFRDSPDRVEHAVRSATLERLRAENAALLARMGDLERGAGGAAGAQQLVPRESLVTAQAEIDKLKAAVQQKDTLLKRISQAVTEKTEAMRLAVQKLLGYQLSFLDSGRIRVTSVYAPSKDRSLAFDPWPGGPMPFRLVSAADDPVMAIEEVRRSIGFWLDGRNSLPGFMASLTMTLWEESTQGQAGGVVFG